MEVNSAIVGYQFRERAFTVTSRQSKNYAAAVFDRNPIYFDDMNQSEWKAHPMIAVTLSWQLFESFYRNDEFPVSKNIFRSMVHYKEVLYIERLINPGEEVNVSGMIQAVLPHKDSSLVVIKVNVSSSDKNELIHTEYLTALLRSVKCTDGGKQLGGIPSILTGDNSSSIMQKEIVVPYEAPYIYDAGADIHFDIHTSKRFARQLGLSNIIMQGTATLAYAVRDLVDMVGEKRPNFLKAISGRFTNMVYPNSTITLHVHHIEERDNAKEVLFSIINEAGETAIKDGYLKFLIG